MRIEFSRACRSLIARSLFAGSLLAFSAFGNAQEKSTDPAAKPEIYKDGWIDFNKNGKMDPYEDPKLDVEKRIDDLLSQMNSDEKTMQLVTLYGYGRVVKEALPVPEWKNQPWKDGIANIDEHVNGVSGKGKEFATPPSRAAEVINTVQRWFVEETRLGIPVDFTNEGIRGLCAWGATSFPNQVGIAAAWDKELAGKIGHVIGREARAYGYTNVYSPILDLARDPRWGRVVETFGEDPFLVSTLGVEQVKGMQAEHTVSSVKHFAVYSIPKGGRDGEVRTDPHASLREIETTELAPFRAAFTKGGAMGTMASYNDYNGIPVITNPDFGIRRLRDEWGFKGYIVSDSGAVEMVNKKHFISPDAAHSAAMVLNGGMNVRTDFNSPMQFVGPLREALKDGLVTTATLDARVREVLRTKFWIGLFDKPYVEDPKAADTLVGNPESQALALRASRESLVLLKNANDTLPLDKNIKSILVTGPLADEAGYADNRYGPYRPDALTPFAAIKKHLGDKTEVKYVRGSGYTQENWPRTEVIPEPLSAKDRAGIAEAVEAAKGVDAVVVCVGENGDMVGEAKSRTSLDLPRPQEDLVEALVGTGKPVVVVLINGRALSINWIDEKAPAIIEAWNPGQYGGPALADVIFGDYNPGGKTPVTFPRTVGQIPWNFPAMPSSQAWQDKKKQNWVGKTEIDGALYPFGYGLSYTTFEYKNMQVEPKQQKNGGNVTVTLDVTNTGKRAGDAVVQLYLRDVLSSVITYEKNLTGFERVPLEPGQTQKVSFTLTPENMQLLNANMKWVVEPGEFKVMAGDNSEDTPLSTTFEITE